LAGGLVRVRSGTAIVALTVTSSGRVIQPAVFDGVIGHVSVPPVLPLELHADPNQVMPALEMFTS
jgi:hypothetical protein